MKKETLFLKTLQEIDNRLQLDDEYEILMISGLLRKLFLDATPLIHQISKQFNIKVKFVINNIPIPSFISKSTILRSVNDGLDPLSNEYRNQKEVDLNQFLKIKIMVINGEVITIFNLIKYLSHVQGAIHAGSAKESIDTQLKDLDDSILIGGFPGALRMIKPISRIILRGLTPLKNLCEVDI